MLCSVLVLRYVRMLMAPFLHAGPQEGSHHRAAARFFSLMFGRQAEIQKAFSFACLACNFTPDVRKCTYLPMTERRVSFSYVRTVRSYQPNLKARQKQKQHHVRIETETPPVEQKILRPVN